MIAETVYSHLFARGLAGTGKTTAGIKRLEFLINSKEYSNDYILVLTPQRVLAAPYQKKILADFKGTAGQVTIHTMSSLIQTMLALFWPVIGFQAGFHNPYRPPHFLTIETAQYYMAHLVKPMLDQGSFSTVSMKRTRLISQLLDNLNKSAIVGFPHTEVGFRLQNAWIGEVAQMRVYEDVQSAINQFRAFCLENNLLDFSLQVELFGEYIWPNPVAHKYITGMFQHLIYDNVEEDPPDVHDIIENWLPEFRSSLIIFDDQAGFRSFLGADPKSALRFEPLATRVINFDQTVVPSQALISVRNAFLNPQGNKLTLSTEELNKAISQPEKPHRFFPEVLDDVSTKIIELVNEGVQPGNIAVMAPFITDSLVFTFSTRLGKSNIPFRVIRPSTSLIDDPYIRCLSNLSILAHPKWGLRIHADQRVTVLVQSITGLDPVRAKLYTNLVCKEDSERFSFLSFSDLPMSAQERIGEELGRKLDQLVNWINTSADEDPLDIFLSRLFGELLSQPGFGFHDDLASGKSTSNLIESFRKFRRAVSGSEQSDMSLLGKEFIQTLQEGVISALYLEDWRDNTENSVLIAPTTTFLMQNQTMDYLFWLDVGSPGWYERLEQPLTHPYVLSRAWKPGRQWTSENEKQLSSETLNKIFNGLLIRCRKGIFLGISQFNEAGMEERGLLLTRLQNMYRQVLKAGQNG